MKKANLKSRKSAPELQPHTLSTPMLKSQRSKSTFNLPKIRNSSGKDVSSLVNSNANPPSPVTRILMNISQILDDDAGKEESQEILLNNEKKLLPSSSYHDSEEDGITSSMSALSLSAEMMEMMMDEGIDNQGEFLPRFQNISYSNETRRKVIKNCLDLKRIFDKESIPISADSSIQKSMFAKSGANIGVLFRCLKEFLEVDTSVVITNLLMRVITSSECSAGNISSMAKKQLCPILIQNIQAIYSEHLGDGGTNLSVNMAQRVDEVFLNLFTLLTKIAKHEPKMALLARLHGSVLTSVKLLKRSLDKRDFSMMQMLLSSLKIFISKNENNLITAQRSNLVSIIDSICKIHSQQISTGKLDTVIELLSHLAKSKAIASDILKYFGMKFFLQNCTSLFEGLQKASLKVIRALNEFEFGKAAFVQAEGSKILSDALNNLLQNSDSISISSVNSVASLLVTALRSAAGLTELPFMKEYSCRNFPLPEKNDESLSKNIVDEDNKKKSHPIEGSKRKHETKDVDYEALIEECARSLMDGTYPIIPNPPDSVEDLVRIKLRRLCPELSYMDHSSVPKCESPNSNISVRHVQPMAPGKHVVCKTHIPVDPEPLLKRSPAIFRKIMFDQTARMFQSNQKGGVVYNVMDPLPAQISLNDPTTLNFESRFESGNLQLAIKISQFEYELLLETDINTGIGKHNQWFYFSIKKMIPNVPYRFNILNMSKPASQFNNGMQPVMYSLLEPGWKRVGDFVFYIKNHYSKPANNSSTEEASLANSPDDFAPTSGNTYCTLVFSITFKGENDHCFLAYHYPYTYSELQRSIYQLQNTQRFRQNCRRTLLCRTLGGNDCILLTITDFENNKVPMSDRKHVFLSARVHPGESNSSHMMQGVIQYLLSSDETASSLRQTCIFKIIPMLNPDGVINGSHRCSMAGVDLNRQWKDPCRIFSPTIFWAKLLLKFLVKLNRIPMVSCDFHGHSRKKNVFVFGCENAATELDGIEKIFPQMLSQNSPIFDFNSCKFNIEKSKETTARVVLRKDMHIVNSFTLESTYAGMDIGEKRGFQIQIQDLERIGTDFVKSLHTLLYHSNIENMCSPNPFETLNPISGESSTANTPKRTRKVKITIKKGKPKKQMKTDLLNSTKAILSKSTIEEDDDDSG